MIYFFIFLHKLYRCLRSGDLANFFMLFKHLIAISCECPWSRSMLSHKGCRTSKCPSLLWRCVRINSSLHFSLLSVRPGQIALSCTFQKRSSWSSMLPLLNIQAKTTDIFFDPSKDLDNPFEFGFLCRWLISSQLDLINVKFSEYSASEKQIDVFWYNIWKNESTNVIALVVNVVY